MAILSQSEMFPFVLSLVEDLPEFTRRQVKQLVCDRLQLSEEEQDETTDTGVRIYESRAGWAVSALSMARYIEQLARSTYRITNRGKEVLNLHLSTKEFSALMRREQQKEMGDKEDVDKITEAVLDETEKSPEEILDKAVEELNDQLSNELMSSIMKIEGRQGDVFFEKLVTGLVARMGYGEGRVTPPSGDAGIDGIITTDKLGFDPIMIQAKRYAPGNQVGRPEIQAFAGALGAVTRGVFITTSTFSNPAKEFAKTYPHATILLIDGKRLTQLMIEYNVGVSEERTIHIKRLDNDYFD